MCLFITFIKNLQILFSFSKKCAKIEQNCADFLLSKGEEKVSVKGIFAHTLYFERTKRGLNQSQVAEAAGISLRQYQDLELGRSETHLSTAMQLATVLGVSLDSLIPNAQSETAAPSSPANRPR